MLRGFITGGFWGLVIGFLVVGLTSQLADWRDLTPAITEELAEAAPEPAPAPADPEAAPVVPPTPEEPPVAPLESGAVAEVATEAESPAVETQTAQVPQSGDAPEAPAAVATPNEAPVAPRIAIEAPRPLAPSGDAQIVSDANPDGALSAEATAPAAPAPQAPVVDAGAPQAPVAIAGDTTAPSAPEAGDVIALARPKSVPTVAEPAKPAAPAVPEAPAPAPAPEPEPEPEPTPEPAPVPEPEPAPAPAPAPQPEPQPEAPAPAPEAQPTEPQGAETAGTIGNLAQGIRVNRLPTTQSIAQEAAAEASATAPDSASAFAIERNAEAFERESDAPVVAIVVIHEGDGLPDSAVLAAIDAPLSFAVDARSENAGAIAAAYRAAGREVALIPDFPARARPADVEVALAVNLEQVPQAVAIMDAPEPRFQTNRAAVAQVVSAAAESGHGVVTFSRGLNSAAKEAEKAGVPAGLIFRDIDGQGDANAIRRTLDQAAFRARQEDRVIILARSRPEVLDALREWSNDAGVAGSGALAFAPLSAVLLGK